MAHTYIKYNMQYTTYDIHRGGSRTAVTSTMDHFVIIVNGWKPLTIITKTSILDIAAVLDSPLIQYTTNDKQYTTWNKISLLNDAVLGT